MREQIEWGFVLLRNLPLLIVHIVSYVFGKPTEPRPFRLLGRRFWIRNTNTIGMLQKSLLETRGIRRKAYSESDVFIDVGGHAGAKTFAAKYVNPGMHVFLFEPNPLNIELLKLTFDGVENVEIVEVGIGNASTTQTLYIDMDHLDTASLDPEHFFLNKNRRRELIEKEVQIIPLDAFFSKKRAVDKGYLKIDVESTESAVLAGGTETLKKCAYLEIEVTQGDKQSASDILLKLAHQFEFDVLDSEFIGVDKEGSPKAINFLLKRKDIR